MRYEKYRRAAFNVIYGLSMYTTLFLAFAGFAHTLTLFLVPDILALAISFGAMLYMRDQIRDYHIRDRVVRRLMSDSGLPQSQAEKIAHYWN